MRKITRLMALLLMTLPFVFISCSDDDYNGRINVKTDTTTKVETAGTLRILLDDSVHTTTSLNVVGNINGDDIKCLRQMMRCTDESSYTWGLLKILDLFGANIVEGGDVYYKTFCTSNDEIGPYMFQNCAILETIALPNSATKIDSYAFYKCSNLKDVVLGNNLLDICEYAFAYCTTLTSLTIPNSVRKLGTSAFESCTSISDLTIGSGVTSMGYDTFYGCTALETVTSLNPTPPSIQRYTFTDVDKTVCVLRVPNGSKEAYSTATGWEDFPNIVEID